MKRKLVEELSNYYTTVPDGSRGRPQTKSRRIAPDLAIGSVLHAIANKTCNESEESIDDEEADAAGENEEEEGDDEASTVGCL